VIAVGVRDKQPFDVVSFQVHASELLHDHRPRLDQHAETG
jgi:hypothetical protein